MVAYSNSIHVWFLCYLTSYVGQDTSIVQWTLISLSTGHKFTYWALLKIYNFIFKI